MKPQIFLLRSLWEFIYSKMGFENHINTDHEGNNDYKCLPIVCQFEWLEETY